MISSGTYGSGRVSSDPQGGRIAVGTSGHGPRSLRPSSAGTGRSQPVRSEFRRPVGLGGLELIAADSHGSPFPVHSHDEYTLVVIEAGHSRFICGQEVCDAGPGSLILLEPGVPHTGGAVEAHPIRYRTLMVPIGLMLEANAGRGRAAFRAPVVHDSALSQLVMRLHTQLMEARDPIALRGELLVLLEQVVERYGSAPVPEGDAREPRRVRVVREHLAANLTATASLDELSDLVSVSPFYLQRTFKAVTRMSPREYLMDLRIRRARALLREGMVPRAVATSVGFFDQSHFTRAFRKLTGVTPGVYGAGFCGARDTGRGAA